MPAAVPISDVLPFVRANNPYISPETMRLYEVAVALVKHWQPGVTCDEFFRIERIREWVQWLAEAPIPHRGVTASKAPRERSTVKARMLLVRTLWRRAKECGLCSQDVAPANQWPKIKVQHEDPVAWDLDEMAAILRQALKAPAIGDWTPRHWWTVLAGYFVTVERQKALLACGWTDLNWSDVLSIKARTTKNGTPGTHRLPQWLAHHIRQLPVVTERIWPWQHSAGSMRYHYRRYILRPLGFPETRDRMFHCLRRTGVTELVNQLGLEAASEHARHSGLGLTAERYVSKAKLRAVSPAEILGKAIEPI